MDLPTSSPMPLSLASNAVRRCGPPSMFSQGGIDVHVPPWLQRAPSIGCSMGAACMWSEGGLWAVSHGDRAALRKQTPTFASRTACAQLGSGGACGGRSSGAGASRPNAFRWCTMHQHRARCTCRQHPEPEMGCCSARACKVLPNTSRPSIVLKGDKMCMCPHGRSEHVATSCSMGAACMWSKDVPRAGFHDDHTASWHGHAYF